MRDAEVVVQAGADQSARMGVFVGRFQPFHLGHLHVVRSALQSLDRLLVVIGSAHQPRGLAHPFTAEERGEMILACLTPEERARVMWVAVEDSCDDVPSWVEEIRALAARARSTWFGDVQVPVALVGHEKDHTSYYLGLFPEWGRLDVSGIGVGPGILSATDLRAELFGSVSFWTAHLIQDEQALREVTAEEDQARVKVSLRAFLERALERGRERALAWLASAPAGVLPETIDLLRAFVQSAAFESPCMEAAYVAHFRYPWRHSPYKPLFVTADPVVFHEDAVLLVRRAGYPGRGQWALPGGFVEEDEPIYRGCLRELAEETALGLSEEVLASYKFFEKCYDAPRRSIRGRVITHAYAFDLPSTLPCPEYQMNEESLDLQWVPIKDLRREETFEDHYAIIHRCYRELRLRHSAS